MRGMGPESLLVKSRVDPRVELAQYALRDGARVEARVVEEMLRRELELFPARHSAVRRLLRWGRERLRRDDVPLAGGPAVWRAREGAEARELADATLAAMPAMRAPAAPEGASAPLSAIPRWAPR